VIFGSSDEDAEKSEALIKTLLNRQVDGFIIAPAEGTSRQISKLVKEKIPVVLIDRYFPEVNVSHLCIDNFQATYDAALHLISGGFKHISLVAYKSALIHMKERIRGYSEAMADHDLSENIKVSEIHIDNYQSDIEKVFDDLNFTQKNDNALIFATNALSVSGLYCTQNHCLKIPQDISFVGFDGGESFDLFDPPLTYVKQPLEEMGKEAFNILQDLIKGSGKITQITMAPELVVRNSSKCVENLMT
jgi:LacI family transcriptional regulator